MKYILLFLFFCLSLGQLQRISLFDSQVHVYFHDIFLLLFVAINLFNELKDKAKRHKLLTDLKPFLPLIITGIASLIYGFWYYTTIENFVGLAYFLRLIILFIFFVQIRQASSQIISKSLSRFLLISVLALSYIQYFFFPNFWPLVYLGWDPHLYRAVGSYFDATTAGTIFLLLAYSSYFFYKKSNDKKDQIIAFLFVPLIFLTYSRITYLALIISLSYLLIKNKRTQLFFGLASLFIIIVILLPRPEGAGVQLERVFSIKSRIVENKQAIVLFMKNPLLGVGYNRIAPAKKNIELPNAGNSASGFPSSFMTVLASMGLMGLASFVYLFINLWNKSNMEQRTLLVALFTSSLLENVFFVNFVFLFFAICYKHLMVRTEP